MDVPRTGLAATLRRVLRRDGERKAVAGAETEPTAPAAPAEAPNGVPTPQQLSAERAGADPVWDC